MADGQARQPTTHLAVLGHDAKVRLVHEKGLDHLHDVLMSLDPFQCLDFPAHILELCLWKLDRLERQDAAPASTKMTSCNRENDDDK